MLEPNGYGHFVDGSTRLQFAISGSIPELGKIFKSKHLISLWRLPGRDLTGFWSRLPVSCRVLRTSFNFVRVVPLQNLATSPDSCLGKGTPHSPNKLLIVATLKTLSTNRDRGRSQALAQSCPWALALAASFAVHGNPKAAPRSPAHECGSEADDFGNHL